MYCAGHLIQAAVAASARHRRGPPARGRPAVRRPPGREFLGAGAASTGTRSSRPRWSSCTGRPATAVPRRWPPSSSSSAGTALIGDSGLRPRYLQDHLPVREATEWSATRCARCTWRPASSTSTLETGDESLLAALRRAGGTTWSATKTSLTGGIGSRHSGESFGDRYELPPDRAYNETCAAIASIQWSWRLLLATGEGRYADLIERTLYNGFAAAISADGQPVLLRQPAAAPGRPLRGRRPRAPPRVVLLRLLPAEHHAAHRLARRHYVATTAGDALLRPPVHRGTHQPTCRRALAGRRHRLPLVRPVDVHGASAPAGDRGAGAAGPRAGAVHHGRGRTASRRWPTPDERGYVVPSGDGSPATPSRCELDITPRLTYPHRRIDARRGLRRGRARAARLLLRAGRPARRRGP